MENLSYYRTFSTGVCFALIAMFLGLSPVMLQAQSYDLLIDNGHVIDPKNGIDQPMDLAIAEGKIARVAPVIPASQARQVIDAAGLYVSPGLIDIHAHVYVGSDPDKGFDGGLSSVSPDDFSFRSGVTTMVDAGDAGWRNFPDFKRRVIDASDTRVLAFLNIFGHGLTSGSGVYDLDDLDVEQTVAMMKRYPDLIVGPVVGHYLGDSWVPIEKTLESARQTGQPILLECHVPELPLEKLLERMRPGDIFTHAFGQVGDREVAVDEQGQVRDYVKEAAKKGIVLDVGHGGGSFHYSQAMPALRQGLLPDTFGTDLHRYSMNDGMKNLLNIMSKYLNMGLSIQQLVERGSWRAAKAIDRPDLGHLSEGAVADVTILDIVEGEFGFVDAGGYKITGDRKLEAELTIRAGEIMWDLNGLAAKMWNEN